MANHQVAPQEILLGDTKHTRFHQENQVFHLVHLCVLGDLVV